MSSISATTLAVSSNATLAGPIALTGATTANNISMPTGNFSQGTGTFSTGSGTNYLNGPIIANSTATFNTTISVQSGIVSNGQISANSTIVVAPSGYIKLPSTQILGSGITLVDTTTAQVISAGKTFSSQIVANGGVNAGSNSIICGALTCSSETDTGALSATGLISANGGLTINSTKTLTLPSTRAITSSNDVVDTTYTQTISGSKTFSSQIIASGGIGTNNSVIDTGSGNITTTGTMSCGTLSVGSGGETDSGILNVKAQLNLYALTSANYTQIQTANDGGGNCNTYYDNIPYLTGTAGSGHVFRIINNAQVSSSYATIANINNSGLTLYGAYPITCGGTITSTGLITANGGLTASALTVNTANANLYNSLAINSTSNSTLNIYSNLTSGQFNNIVSNNLGITGDVAILASSATPTNTALTLACNAISNSKGCGVRITPYNVQINNLVGSGTASTITMYGATTCNDSFTASGGLTIPSGQTLTNSGTISGGVIQTANQIVSSANLLL